MRWSQLHMKNGMNGPLVAVPKRDPAEYSAAEKDALYAELLDILGQHLPKWQLPDGLV